MRRRLENIFVEALPLHVSEGGFKYRLAVSVIHTWWLGELFEDYRGIPREAMYLIYGSFFPSLAFGMFFTDLPYFLSSVQGLSDTYMGTVIMAMGISMVLSSIPLGIAADRYGRRKFLAIGNVIASLVIILFSLTAEPAILILAAVLEGIAEAAYSASSSAIIAEKAGAEKRTSVFSLFWVINNVAFGLGGIIIPSVLVFESAGFGAGESHMLLYSILGVMSLASTLILLKVSESKTLNRATSFKDMLPRKSKAVLVRYVVAASIIGLGAGMFIPLMTRWMDLRYGVSDAVSGPVIGISSLMIGLASLAAPAIARRLGVVKSIIATEAVSTVFMFAMPFSPTFVVASGVYTVRTFLMNMANPLQQSLIMGLVTPDERGAASGISSALTRLPNSLSAVVGAGLMDQGMLAEPFYLATVLYIISITIFWFVFGRVRLPEEVRRQP